MGSNVSTSEEPVADLATAPTPTERVARTPVEEARITVMVHAHFQFVWRSLRRMGVPASAADDAAQQVFLVAARRLNDIVPAAEKSFLFETARRVASDTFRASARSRERVSAEGNVIDLPDEGPSPEEQLGRARALEMLDTVLAELEDDLRAVLVLYEIEGLETAEIAGLLGIPAGTVASRLRRAREEFHKAVKRASARRTFREVVR
jgi:RNA polymerase sigma-70 factor (ECF subfamily)